MPISPRISILCVALALAVAAPPLAHANSSSGPVWRPASIPPVLVAPAAFVLDDTTGRTLYAENADIPRYPASTVKMLTAIVALQHLRLNHVVIVPAGAFVGGTTAGLAAGERITVRQLFYGMLLPSGNDAAVTLGDAVAGSPWAFGALMNDEARHLHLWHSHFMAPHGFDIAGQYSTARDLAWLAHALLRRPFLARVVETREYRAVTPGGYVHDWVNLNQLLWSYPGTIGVKTGTTPLAGANLVACTTRHHHRIIAVIMGSTVADRYSDATNLLNYAWGLVATRQREH